MNAFWYYYLLHNPGLKKLNQLIERSFKHESRRNYKCGRNDDEKHVKNCCVLLN